MLNEPSIIRPFTGLSTHFFQNFRFRNKQCRTLLEQIRAGETEPLRLRVLDVVVLLIIPSVARGWESKSIEDQQAQASDSRDSKKPPLTPQQQAIERQKQSLLLSRQRIIQQLQSATHPNYRATLKAALAELDSQLSRLG